MANPYPEGTPAHAFYAHALCAGLDADGAQRYTDRMLRAQRKYLEEEQAVREREQRLRQAREEAQAKAHSTGTYVLEDMRTGSVEAFAEGVHQRARRAALFDRDRPSVLVEPVRESEYSAAVMR